jgi:hypothetical protein
LRPASIEGPDYAQLYIAGGPAGLDFFTLPELPSCRQSAGETVANRPEPRNWLFGKVKFCCYQACRGLPREEPAENLQQDCSRRMAVSSAAERPTSNELLEYYPSIPDSAWNWDVRS